VVRTATEVNAHVWSKPYPKSRAGRRIVPLPSFVGELLAVHARRYPAGQIGEVFTNEVRGPRRRSIFRTRTWRPALVRAGLFGKMVQTGEATWRATWADAAGVEHSEDARSEPAAVALVVRHHAGGLRLWRRPGPQWVHLDALDGEAVGSQLHALVVDDKDQTDRLLRAQRRLARLDKERLKLVQMAYADAIPIEVLKAEQQRVTREREEAVLDEREAQDTGADHGTYRQAQALMQRGAEAYRLGGPTVRRLLTRAFLARIEVDTDDEQATLASPWREIRDAAAHARKLSARPPEQHPRRRPSTTRRGSRANPGLLSEGQGSNKNPLVELLGRYSNWTSWADHLQSLDQTGGPGPESRSRPRGTARRLSECDVTDLVMRYRDGATVYELAERFSIHRTTVSGHLHRRGIKMRGHSLDERQAGVAIELYEQGWSTARIGRHLGVNGSSVWLALRARGVRMRDAQGRAGQSFGRRGQ
jgi:hypothetical protein